LAYKAGPENGSDGLFTGYYEPELRGAKTRGGAYQVPLYSVPSNRVTVDLGAFDPELKGKRIIGRLEGSRLRPYYARADIENGALSNQAAELVWLDDALDAFILHVQGSGFVSLPNGGSMRVGFAGHNGRKYNSIGRALIERGELEKGRASWQHIRNWLEINHERAAEVFAVNPRYIFFREIDGDGPVGAVGVVLTPGRSLAIDPSFVPLDVPLWLDAEHPVPGNGRLQRLVLTQDTGGAIKGPVRGDVFWGTGKDALAIAGRMRSRGAYYLLLPRSVAAPKVTVARATL
jgi:membrane-bound lytic murein transglycosylase A